MSSDNYFDGEDNFDADALAQIDAIEAAHFSPRRVHANNRPGPLTKEDSYDDISFNVNESELRKLDDFIKDSYEGNAAPVAGPSRTFARTPSANMVQTTLFGGVAGQKPSTSSNKPRSQLQKTTSSQRNPFGQQARKTKKWDQTAFAKTGLKGKGRADGDGDELEGEPPEFEQFPAPFISLGPPPPMKLVPDLLEAKHWIYPINRPKRDYQYNIVKRCLFDNTLVALPTGLGKTFIAGVVMLNFYRWFPEGKVVFVAPTKPLVAQQVIACHDTCGIPGSDSIELTGEVPRNTRIRYWGEKRVFFMTPQTLVNDLVKETCDVRDIILLVVDEAHRATGNYAYNQAIRFLMAKNPHFRVIALTATPGNDAKTVQTLIDGLHISRIEIRNEGSLDLRPYIHKKIFVPHIIKANPAVAKIRDLLANVMKPLMKPMQQAGILRPNESAVSIHPYRPQAIVGELRDKRFLWPLLMLSKLARAMLYLLTGSIEACYQFLYDISNDQETDEGGDPKKQKPRGKKLKDDPNFRTLMQELERQKTTGFELHPKIEVLLDILIQHFGQSDEGLDETRVMVFSSYRAVVDRIVEELSKHQPLLRATRFIGQGMDKQGKKGLAQKEQHEVIEKFQAGVYNILVATSIGEEGLDIGEIDITICYDADKAPTRMIQRFGRTGRKRDGTIHALLSEEREELNIEKAESTYREVQKQISRGELYELYEDVERLIPHHIKPECIEKVVEIQQYVRERNSPKRKAPAPQGTKRKRNDDIMRNIPLGATNGFVSVRDLLTKNPKQKKIKISKDFEACGQDDATDEDIESGRVMAPPRRTQSAAVGSVTKSTKRGKLRKSSTITGSKANKPRRKKDEMLTSSQFAKQGSDDSDDMDIEQGAILARRQRWKNPRKSDSSDQISDKDILPRRSPLKKAKSRILSLTPEPVLKEVDPTVVELTDSEPSQSMGNFFPMGSTPVKHGDEDMGWLVEDDEDNLAIEIVNSSPILYKGQQSPRIHVGDESMMISWPKLSDQGRNSSTASNTLVGDSVVDLTAKSSKGKESQLKNYSIPESLDSPVRQPAKKPVSPTWDLSSSPLYPARDRPSMQPPALPRRFLDQLSASTSNQDTPEFSHPVRPLGHQAKRKSIPLKESGSPVVDGPQRRLHRLESTPDSRQKKTRSKRTKPSLLSKNINPLFDGEATHSGDEVSEGLSNSEDDVESESDRQFIKDSPPTQVSQSYEQTQIYRRSLMTQFDGGAGLAFAHAPVRPRPFGMIEGPHMNYHSGGGLPSSSPPIPDDELDNYEFGSFVVADDDISYAMED